MNLVQIDRIITGVWAIFLYKKNALSYFVINSRNFFLSFSVIILVLIFQIYMAPLEIEIFSTGISELKLEDTNTSFQFFILMTNWFIWPVVTYVVCNLMGLSHNYMRYVTIDNLSSIVTLTIIATPAVLFQFGLPADAARTLIYMSSFIMLIYKWRVIKLSLATTGANASILLFIDIAVTILVSTIVKTVFVG
ncbi:MAG: hypothetical protein OCD03_05325 [Hyphomicrobiales bacterium]